MPIGCRLLRLGSDMRRREFITLFGGAAAVWPIAVHAQQPDRIYRIGVLMSTDEFDLIEFASVRTFAAALEKLGWVQGRNLEMTVRWAAGDPQRMEANARELVSVAPAALLVKGANVPAAQRATATIPIVFVVLGDANAETYVGSFARPRGNMTGFTSYERALVGKRLTILRQLASQVTRVLYIRSQMTGTDTLPLYEQLVADAGAVHVPITDAACENEAEIAGAVQSFARQPGGGLMAAFDAFTTVHRSKIIDLAVRSGLPAIYPLRAFVQSGGLCSYGFDQDEQFRQAAGYVARILNGEKPGALPVQAPNKFDLLINLKAAKVLGLDVPSGLLATADEVIE